MEFLAESYGQNTKQVQKITQIQHHLQFSFKFQMGINIKSVQAYLIGLSFPLASEEIFLKNKLDRETDTSCEKFQKCSKKRYYFQQQFETHFWPRKR